MVGQDTEKKDLVRATEKVFLDRHKIWQQRLPMGLIAVAVIILSWFGIYLLWRGFAPLIGF